MVPSAIAWFGGIGSFLSLASVIPYGYGIAKRRIHPHLFTWLIWSVVTVVATAGQFVSGAGPAAWCTASIALTCLVIFVASLFRGDPSRTRFDWGCLIIALLAIPLWLYTSDPTVSICMVTFIEILGVAPTTCKVLFNPWDESLSYFLLSALKYALALLALETWTIAAAIYPVVTLMAVGSLCVLIILRRRAIPKFKPS